MRAILVFIVFIVGFVSGWSAPSQWSVPNQTTIVWIFSALPVGVLVGLVAGYVEDRGRHHE